MSSGPSELVSERVLGRLTGNRPGPTVIVCGALHGNEPAGVNAARNVHKTLVESGVDIRGEWIAITGNLAAIAKNRRYLEQDLNRCWTQEQVQTLLASDPASDHAESAEQRAILSVLDDAAQRARGPVVLIDLHTTSSESPPFLVFCDTLANRAIAAQLPGTMILGLEEAVDGTLLDFASEIGHCAVVIESGQHQDPTSVTLHESYIWLALAATGSLLPSEVPHFSQYRATLQSAAQGSPRCVDVLYRHPVSPEDEFQMAAGHETFSIVRRNAALARDKNGDVRAPCNGLMLMPLYQAQGSDGFFIVGVVRPFWLALSRVLRTLRLHVVLPLLPGVCRMSDGPAGNRAKTLRVDPRVARWLTAEVFHLFGYRKRGAEGDKLTFVKRD